MVQPVFLQLCRFLFLLPEQSEAEFLERHHAEVSEQIKAAVWTVGLTPPADMKLVLLTLLLLVCTSQGEEPSLRLLFELEEPTLSSSVAPCCCAT